jgi:hypothetical protein
VRNGGWLCIVGRFESEQDQSAHLFPRLLFDVDTQQVVDERSDASLVPITDVGPRQIVERDPELTALVLNTIPLRLVIESTRHTAAFEFLLEQ